MNVLAAALFVLAAKPALAASYSCEVKARDNYMDPFVHAKGEFNGTTSRQLVAKGFTMKIIPTIVDGQPLTAIWLGLDEQHSTVTLAPLAQDSLYINSLNGDQFAVGTCTKN